MRSIRMSRQWLGGLSALLVCTACPAVARDEVLTEYSAPSHWRLVSAQRLAEVRGGFDMPQLQLRLSFGLEQSVLVNGELVARTVLNIEQLRQAVANQIQATRTSVLDSAAGLNAQVQAQVAAQLQAVGLRTTTINTVAAASPQAQVEAANAAAQVAVSAPPSAPSSAPASSSPPVTDVGSVTQPTVVQSVVAAPSADASAGSGAVAPVQVVSPAQDGTATVPVTVVQAGSGNVVSSASVVGNDALTTVIQNTLDNQRIQVLTEVSASANSLQVLRAMNMGAAIREGVINSLRR